MKLLLKLLRASSVALLWAPLYGTAGGQVYGDWAVENVGTELSEALTSNQSGSSFGYICTASDQSCLYYIDSQTPCEEGATTPVLINADSGAVSIDMKCIDIHGDRYHVLQDAQSVRHAVTTGATIGFAIPLQDGQFKVVRFSLSGALQARQEAIRRVESNKPADIVM